MTVNALHKILSKLIAHGKGRLTVCVDKPTITHPLESDGACIIPICGCVVRCHEMMDDDGGPAEDSRGRAKYRTSADIVGAAYDPSRAE